MKGCSSDRECRVEDGYVCDRQWHTCLLPNFAAILPASCPPTGAPVQDTAFGPSEPYTSPPREVDDELTRVKASDGRVHVVTMLNGSPMGGFGSAQQSIVYVASTDGGATFSRTVTVSGHEEVLPYFFARPAIAVDVQRRWLYIAYVRGGRDAKWDIVLAVSKDSGATWTRKKLAGDNCAIHMSPSLALDPRTGTVHVAYYDSVGGGRYARTSCAAGGVKCKSHGAINTIPFVELRTVRNSPRSIDGHARLDFDAKTRSLHAVWAQVVDENGTRVARSFHSTAKLK